jgi:hypothetical protein
MRKILAAISGELRDADGNLPSIQDCITFALVMFVVFVVSLYIPEGPEVGPANYSLQSTQP